MATYKFIPGNSPRAFLSVRRLRSGTSATELAVLLPLIVGLCLVAVDLGRFGYTYIALSQAVQVGSQYGASRDVTSFSESDWLDQVEQAVVDEMTGIPNFDPGRLNVTISTVEEPDGLNRIELDATYPFDLVIDWPFVQNPLVLRRTYTTRQFQ